MARIKTYTVRTNDGKGTRHLVLFRHSGEEKPAGTYDDIEDALAMKQRAERAKREGRLDEFAAGLLGEESSSVTLWEFIALWFKEDAAPNLAEATLVNYLHVANKWIRPIAGSWPLRAFEKPRAVNELLRRAERDGVPRLGPNVSATATLDYAGEPTRDRIRKILSSALTWGVEHRGELIGANGCKQVTSRRRRRSKRSGVRSPASRPERALNAFEAEVIAHTMLARRDQRTWQPHRDAIFVRCLFGLGLRPEELVASRWSALAQPSGRGDWILVIDHALSHGSVTAVKTVERSKRVPPYLLDRLEEWRACAAGYGLPAGEGDFIVPGRADGGHFTLNQHKKWGPRYFAPAAERVSRQAPQLAHLAHATPYAARRGHISCRILAGEPVEAIARSCGTSAATIYRHYFVAIDAVDAGHRLPSFDEQLANAAAEVGSLPATRVSDRFGGG